VENKEIRNSVVEIYGALSKSFIFQAAVYNPKETMAAVLTRKLLRERFPTLNPDLLDELMEVHGNSFDKTKQMIQEHFMNSYTVKQRDFPVRTFVNSVGALPTAKE